MIGPQHESKNWLEWLVFAVSSILVLAMIGCLAYQIWAGTPRRSAVIEVKLGVPEKRGDYFAVPVSVGNRGDDTAEDVHVQVTLERTDGSQETAEFQVPFVPRNAVRSGVVTFTTDPASALRLEARPIGFVHP